MDLQLSEQWYENSLSGFRKEKLCNFLRQEGLSYEDGIEHTVIFYDTLGEIVASGSLEKNILKCIAISEEYRGEGITGKILTALCNCAYKKGLSHLFLFTKPKNNRMFQAFGFYEISQTSKMLLMENKKEGIATFLKDLDKGVGADSGVVVANCNPFTLGHRFLIEKAAAMCDVLHVFILSEDKSFFSAKTRYEMVKRGIEGIDNVLLHPTSDYLISAATFPTYFLKDTIDQDIVQYELDIQVFCDWFVPAFSITHRFVGEEPFCRVTEGYNNAMKQVLPSVGVELIEIPRLEILNSPVSASKVRALLLEGNYQMAKALVPQSNWEFLLPPDEQV